MRIIINYSKPRLSDEEMDPIELDDIDAFAGVLENGWQPWDLDDLIDIERIIEGRMPAKPKQIIESFLMGMTHLDIGVSEKYWRYHYDKAVEFIKEELKL
jgi:hypothetical protein